MEKDGKKMPLSNRNKSKPDDHDVAFSLPFREGGVTRIRFGELAIADGEV